MAWTWRTVVPVAGAVAGTSYATYRYTTSGGKNGRTKKVVVVGAGIGGLAAAVALRAQGFEVDVFEKARQLRPVGATLALAPNGLTALNAISTNACERVLLNCTVPELCVVKNLKDQVVKETKFINNKALLVVWHLVQMHLANELPSETIHLGHTFSRYDVDEATRQVKVYFKRGDGSEVEVSGDCLVGADGVNSAVRRAMLGGEVAPVFHNKIMFRAILPKESLQLSSPLPDAGVQFTWSGGRNDLFSLRETGPDHLSFTALRELEAAPAGERGAEARKAWVLELFRGYPGAVQEVLRAAPAESIYESPVLDLAVAAPWAQGPACLLGDAAHTMTADSGQGANLALEDAAELAALLGRAEAEGRGLEQGLAVWEAERRGRVGKVQEASRWLTSSGNPVNTPGTADQPGQPFFSFLYSYSPTLNARGRSLYS